MQVGYFVCSTYIIVGCGKFCCKHRKYAIKMIENSHLFLIWLKQGKSVSVLLCMVTLELDNSGTELMEVWWSITVFVL